MRSLALAAFAAALFFCAPTEAAEPGRLEFELLRNGQPEGRHVVDVRAVGDGVAVDNRVTLHVRAGPLTLYRLEQTCRETWADGELTALSCDTTKNGRRSQIAARRAADGLMVTRDGRETRLPFGALPTTWWKAPSPATRTMINLETGRSMPVRVTRLGRERVTIGGRQVEAERLRVEGTLTADLFYDLEGRWIGCEVTTRGQRFSYRLVSPLEDAPRGEAA